MISAVRRLKDAPSEAKCQKIADMLDQDHDGALDLVDVGTVSNRKLLDRDVQLTILTSVTSRACHQFLSNDIIAVALRRSLRGWMLWCDDYSMI